MPAQLRDKKTANDDDNVADVNKFATMNNEHKQRLFYFLQVNDQDFAKYSNDDAAAAFSIRQNNNAFSIRQNNNKTNCWYSKIRCACSALSHVPCCAQPFKTASLVTDVTCRLLHDEY